jgi:hypothetical protein
MTQLEKHPSQDAVNHAKTFNLEYANEHITYLEYTKDKLGVREITIFVFCRGSTGEFFYGTDEHNKPSFYKIQSPEDWDKIKLFHQKNSEYILKNAADNKKVHDEDTAVENFLISIFGKTLSASAKIAAVKRNFSRRALIEFSNGRDSFDDLILPSAFFQTKTFNEFFACVKRRKYNLAA